MSRTIECVKLNRPLEGMPYRPLDNELGLRIYETISFEAWKMWLEHSKMIVNEYRLDLTSKTAHATLMNQCEEFFFGEGASLPPDFVAPPSK